jgi:hypothetical protein
MEIVFASKAMRDDRNLPLIAVGSPLILPPPTSK